MIWVFIVLSLATISHSIYLLMEHLRDATVIDDGILKLTGETEIVTRNIGEAERDRDAARVRATDTEARVKELENLTAELQTKIEELKKEDERRGRFRVQR